MNSMKIPLLLSICYHCIIIVTKTHGYISVFKQISTQNAICIYRNSIKFTIFLCVDVELYNVILRMCDRQKRNEGNEITFVSFCPVLTGSKPLIWIKGSLFIILPIHSLALRSFVVQGGLLKLIHQL